MSEFAGQAKWIRRRALLKKLLAKSRHTRATCASPCSPRPPIWRVASRFDLHHPELLADVVSVSSWEQTSFRKEGACPCQALPNSSLARRGVGWVFCVFSSPHLLVCRRGSFSSAEFIDRNPYIDHSGIGCLRLDCRWFIGLRRLFDVGTVARADGAQSPRRRLVAGGGGQGG